MTGLLFSVHTIFWTPMVASPQERTSSAGSVSSIMLSGSNTDGSPDSASSMRLLRSQQQQQQQQPHAPQFVCTREKWVLFIAMSAWYLIGVGAIVTTKILLTDWFVPPLLLTFQQLVASSSILYLVVCLTAGKPQLLPWQPVNDKIWDNHSDFILAGLYNALDFMASNTAFSTAAASFVETIKSSDPITTTAIALAWQVDRLERTEGIALSLLIVGVLLSTWGNAQQKQQQQDELDVQSLQESIRGTSVVMIANLCFAFRAMFQKRYRVADVRQLNDVNLLCRMQQMGAVALCVPALLSHASFISQALLLDRHVQLSYLGLATFNACCYATYNLASTFILSKLTVLQHASLGCLRRMFAIVATCLFFGVPMSLTSALGLLTSLVGFFAFTVLRTQRQNQQQHKSIKTIVKETGKDSIV